MARIYISKNKPDLAAKIAATQIDAGVDGDYAVELKLDLAEALALNPSTVAESMKVAEELYHAVPNDPLAPRALYNAAFSALQINQHDKALALSGEFLNKGVSFVGFFVKWERHLD